VVFHPPPSGGRIRDGKLVSPRKDPPSEGSTCADLLGKVCAGEPDRPSGATYYAQTAGDSTGAPGGTMHFGELLAILFHRPGQHNHAKAGPTRLRCMPEH
jgi:hypothetical protein